MNRRYLVIAAKVLLYVFAAIDLLFVVASALEFGNIRLKPLSPRTPFLDRVAVAGLNLSAVLVTCGLLAGLFAALPRPTLRKLVIGSATLFGVAAAWLWIVFRLSRSTVVLPDGTTHAFSFGPTPIQTELFGTLLLSKTVLLAWVVWLFTPAAPRDPLHCATCDYSLTGAASQRCPECGTSLPLHQPPTPADPLT